MLSPLMSERPPLARFPRRDGIYEISPPPRFDGGEEAWRLAEPPNPLMQVVRYR